MTHASYAALTLALVLSTGSTADAQNQNMNIQMFAGRPITSTTSTATSPPSFYRVGGAGTVPTPTDGAEKKRKGLTTVALVMVIVSSMLIIALAVTVGFMAFGSGYKTGGMGQLPHAQQQQFGQVDWAKANAMRAAHRAHRTVRAAAHDRRPSVGALTVNETAWSSPPKGSGRGYGGLETYDTQPQMYTEPSIGGLKAMVPPTAWRAASRAETPAYLQVLDSKSEASMPYLHVYPTPTGANTDPNALGMLSPLAVASSTPTPGLRAATESLAAAIQHNGGNDSLIADPTLFDRPDGPVSPSTAIAMIAAEHSTSLAPHF